jgi:hypothetical protein
MATNKEGRMEEEYRDDFTPVGVGEEYRALREAAKAQLDNFCPWGVENSINSWGIGIGQASCNEDGTHTISILTGFGDWDKPNGLTHSKSFDMTALRAAAISLLVYCEAYDPIDKEEV